MKNWMKVTVTLVWLVAVNPALNAASASPLTTTGATTLDGNAWLKGDRLLVTGSALGLASEKDAKRWAVQNAAAKAAEFLDQNSLTATAMVVQEVEDALLRETPLQGTLIDNVRIEDACQERWTNEEGIDRWSMHLTLSIRVGRSKKK
jgi:hypothetical protein